MHRGRRYIIKSMESPPSFLGGCSFGPYGCGNLMAFATPTTLQYTTQALSTNEITIVKQIKHAELTQRQETEKVGNEDQSTVAGYGVVTVKRTVRGYKKLSLINRTELSRSEISLPSMEFDTRAFWIDVDAIYLKDIVREFDGGVHALSHALVAVAPLFVPCATSDIDCDHSRHDRTQILIYDQRAGGSGITAQLYDFIFDALKASVELLEECTSCYSGKDYDGGCPACLHSIPCDNFHQDLSRRAGINVGKHLIRKLETSSLNVRHGGGGLRFEGGPKKCNPERVGTDMQSYSPLKPNNFVIGRARWMENNKDRSRWAAVDEND
jgi:DEAD/DEAH box helicase domain-containing protein